MNSNHPSVVPSPAINVGVLFILAFALIVGTRPVRTNEPGSDESVTQSASSRLAESNLSG